MDASAQDRIDLFTSSPLDGGSDDTSKHSASTNPTTPKASTATPAFHASLVHAIQLVDLLTL